MTVAEELSCDWRAPKFGRRTSTPKYGEQLTGGSISVRHFLRQLEKRARDREDAIPLSAAEWTASVPSVGRIQRSSSTPTQRKDRLSNSFFSCYGRQSAFSLCDRG